MPKKCAHNHIHALCFLNRLACRKICENCEGSFRYMLGRYVSTRERKFNPIPKVMYVRLFGIDVETGEHRHEDYYP